MGERCRTCQRRKVKCGQEMPICSNCIRLGLKCERRARYKLKDVTQKTRRSIASTTSEKGSIWDPKHVPSPFGDIPDDNYSSMENAAIAEKPGTFFIDSTPENVLDMYNDGEASDVVSSIGTVMDVPPPPRSVFMERFEDYGNSSSVATVSQASKSLLRVALSKKMARSDYSTTTMSTGANLAMEFETHDIQKRVHATPLTMFNKALIHSRDLLYYNHYRSVVVYNMQVNSKIPTSINPFCHDNNETQDPFERAASTFAPLYHAIMALSALSLAHRERLDRVDALEHYQQAVTGLREYTGPHSVNLIYTHYFLLLYEVAACEKGQANLEFNQMANLAGLLGWYFTMVQIDPALVFQDQACPQCTEVTMTCIPSNMLYCDMYNLLLHRQSQVIVPDIMVVGFFNAVEDGQKDIHFEAAYKEHLELAYMMAKLTIRSGWGHRVLRNIIQSTNTLTSDETPNIEIQLLELDEKIQNMDNWCATNTPPLPRDIYDPIYDEMPLQIQSYFDSTQYTRRALLLFAHTSVHPSQKANLTPTRLTQMHTLTQEILSLTRPRWGSARPIAATNLMALFVCGTAVTSKEDKEEVLNVLRMMGSTASGRNFICAVEALELLYKEQDRVKREGRGEVVDWVGFLRGEGMLDFSLFGI